MPRTSPLPEHAAALRRRGWTHLDARCALRDPQGVAWTEGDGLVLAWGSPAVVHAIEEVAFGPTSIVLSQVLHALPHRLELRAGPAGGGILTETHRVELLAPMRRMSLSSVPAAVSGLRAEPLGPADAAAIRAIPDTDAPLPPAALPPGWFGLRRGERLVAAMGPISRGDGVTIVSAPRMDREARDVRTVQAMMHALCSASTDEIALDVRVDRRDRRQILDEVGLAERGSWERWWCVHHSA